MKVSLVVASGVHQGKVIPIVGPQFLIGRDAQCQLRPASQAISKRHCGVLVRDGKVYVRDYGSTNGTTVNDQLVRDAEVPVEDGASVKLGPLDFTLKIERVPVPADGTPLPTAESAAALAAVKAASAPPKPAPRDTTPSPVRPAKPASKESPSLTASKEAAALKPAAPAKPGTGEQPAAPKAARPAESEQDEHDRIAAMLLGMDDDGAEVPDGSTVMDVPVSGQGEKPPEGGEKAEDKSKDGKPVQTREGMSNAASEILRKMMRRPK